MASADKQSAPAVSGDFVGRRFELSVLDAAIDSTLAGQGRLIVLAGEPGMGKSRTAQELCDRAVLRNMQVLWGRCYAEPGAPHYWPWLQAIRAYVQGRSPDEIREIGPGLAEHLSQLAPDVLQHFEMERPLPAGLDAKQARFLLFDAVAQFLRSAASKQPILLILDDLHWADIPSLRLLEFLAGELNSNHLLILGTYRDIELSRQHPLSNTLGELARHTAFQRIHLPGLNLEESRLMLKIATSGDPPPELVTALHTQTEGNPLFLLEIARFLEQEGLLNNNSTSLSHPQFGVIPLPEGVREVIGTRLNRLSRMCNRLLGAAAVIGHRFDIGILGRLMDELTPEHCLKILGEALSIRVVVEAGPPGLYQFSHGLIRETLYEEIPTPVRAGLHSRVGAAIEELHRSDLDPHISILAHHFGAALPGGDLQKALTYAVLAGERADALLAYDEAARHYQLALLVLELQKPTDEAMGCRLLISLGAAQTKAGEFLRAQEAFGHAAATAKKRDAFEDLARAALGFEDANWRSALPGDTAARLLDDALWLSGDGDTILKARLLGSKIRALYFAGDFTKAGQLGANVIAMARRIGDPATLAACLLCRAWATPPWGQDDAELAAEASEAIGLAEQAGDKSRILEAMSYRLDHLFVSGDLQTWESEYEIFDAFADQSHQPFFRYMAATMRSTKAVFEGRFEEGTRLARMAFAIGQRWPGSADGVLSMQMFTVHWGQGRLGEFAPQIRNFVETNAASAVWRPGLALIYRELGLTEQARTEFEYLAVDDFAAVSRDALWLTCIAFLAEVCTYLDDAARAAVLYRFLLPRARCNIQTGIMSSNFGPAARYLGMLAGIMKHWEEAQRHFDAALEMSQTQGARPWMAHTQYEYAAMLFRRKKHGDRERACSLLDGAIEISHFIGMRKLEERAMALRHELGPAANAPRPFGLSMREVEVLRLISEGKSNHEIGKNLFVSPNTVAAHIRNILGKTATSNRAEAAAFAVRHGLADLPRPPH